MTDPIRSNRPVAAPIDAQPTTATGPATHSVSSRAQAAPSHPRDDFGHAPARDRRLDRALGTTRSATSAENTIQQRIALDSRRLGNLGAIVSRMESLPMGPSMEAHRDDVPYAAPLDAAIREQQGEVLGNDAPREVSDHAGEHLALHIGEHLAAHSGARGLATGIGVVGETMSVLNGGIMQAQMTLHALGAGDDRHEAAVRRQAFENHQGRVDGQIAQSRADGRNAMRAADVANTSEPVTIDWNRFQTDGDYAQSALNEARSEMRATQTRMQSDRALLSNAQQMSPQVQAMFPWLVGGPQS